MKKSIFQIAGGAFFFWGLYSFLSSSRKNRVIKEKDVEEQANDYFPVQSPSERAAGHPLVGTA